jgi:hypothetical protein
MKDKDYEEYLEMAFEIRVKKNIGQDHSSQKFYGSKLELAIGIASMMEQLMENHVFTIDELEELLEMAKTKRERNYENDKQRRIYRDNRQTKGNRRYKNSSK